MVSSKLISDTFLLSCPLLPALSVAVIVISSPLAKPSLNIAVLLPSKLSIIWLGVWKFGPLTSNVAVGSSTVNFTLVSSALPSAVESVSIDFIS